MMTSFTRIVVVLVAAPHRFWAPPTAPAEFGDHRALANVS